MGERRLINALGVKFDLPGAAYTGVPAGQRGLLHNAGAESWTLSGGAPSLNFVKKSGSDQPGVITGVGGVSVANEKSRNLRGLTTAIKDAATFFEVVFKDAQGNPDSEINRNYTIVATVNTVYGNNVPAGARIVHISHQKETGFRINLAEAPGAGNTVYVAWVLIR